MKSSNIGSIKISQQRGIWSTTPSNETKLSKAFTDDHLIILIFSVQGSGHFQVTNPTMIWPSSLCQTCVNVQHKPAHSWKMDFAGLCSHDVCHQPGELPGLGFPGFRRSLQRWVDPKGESSFSLHPAYPEPVEWQQEGPDQQGRTGGSLLPVFMRVTFACETDICSFSCCLFITHSKSV